MHNTMKRLFFLLLIFNLQSSIFNVLKAQPHVDAAFRALALEANGGEMAEEKVHTSATDARFTLKMHVNFYLRPEQQGLLTAVYEAMETDRATRTQYYLQDAFSARQRPIRMDTPHQSSYWLTDESSNVLWGGFFVPADEDVDLPPTVLAPGQSRPTLYRYYFLSYQIEGDGMLSGFIERITFDADTQEPHIQQVGRPKYQPLVDAITAFGADPNVQLRRNLSERRAAATGQWTHIHSTLGFNLPLEDEARLLGPLWKAFLQEEQHAYRFLNKPAGQVASDVQIVCDEQGHTIGLGSQQGWNIVYVYFNDEDFPRNRYVYALWYKADVPRQRIVGELIKINTLRPEGGTVQWPFVQTTVPTYLWRMTINPYDYRVQEQDVVAPSSYRMEPDVARMQAILQDLPGLDLQPLRVMLDTLIAGRVRKIDAFNVEMLDIQDRYRESLEGLRGMQKLNIDAKEYEGMSPQERIDYNNRAREQYQAELDRLNKMYSEYVDNIARRHNTQDYGIFRRDSLPSDVFRATFGILVMAYRGDGSEHDALVAERLRQMAEMAGDEASRPVRLGMLQKLDSLASLPHPNLPRNIVSVPQESLAEAVMALDVRPDKPHASTEPPSSPLFLVGNKVRLPNGQIAVRSLDKTTLTLPNGVTIRAGKITVHKRQMRKAERHVHKAERRMLKAQHRMERMMYGE